MHLDGAHGVTGSELRHRKVVDGPLLDAIRKGAPTGPVGGDNIGAVNCNELDIALGHASSIGVETDGARALVSSVVKLRAMRQAFMVCSCLAPQRSNRVYLEWGGVSPHGGVSEYHRLNGRSCGCDQDFDFDTLIQLVEATRAADLVPQCRQEYVRYLAEISHRCVPQTLMTALSNGNGVIVPPVHTITDAVTTARNNASLLASQVAGSDEPFIDVAAIRTQDLDAAIALADRFGTFVALVTGGHVTKGR